MPEGDTVHKLANYLAPLLQGVSVARIETGRPPVRREHLVVESVVATGKHLWMGFADRHGARSALRTHLGMWGSWQQIPFSRQATRSDDADGVRILIDRWQRRSMERVPPVTLWLADRLLVCWQPREVEWRVGRVTMVSGHAFGGCVGPDLIAKGGAPVSVQNPGLDVTGRLVAYNDVEEPSSGANDGMGESRAPPSTPNNGVVGEARHGPSIDNDSKHCVSRCGSFQGHAVMESRGVCPQNCARGTAVESDDLPIDVHRLRAATSANRPMTDILLDQRLASGIGNVYKSELLFLHRVHPLTPLHAIGDDVLARLYADAQALLTRNLHYGPRITRRTAERGEHLWVYGRGGHPCRVCGTPIEFRLLGEHHRSTYYCSRCQPAPSGVQVPPPPSSDRTASRLDFGRSRGHVPDQSGDARPDSGRFHRYRRRPRSCT
ncbi:MAG: DNA-formamidopyrimidine glycosylase family protein [Thioalkalivibrionaceae bacterium]